MKVCDKKGKIEYIKENGKSWVKKEKNKNNERKTKWKRKVWFLCLKGYQSLWVI